MEVYNYTKVKSLEKEVDALDNRVDTIITTPAEEISVEEIVDAREDKDSLGTNIRDIRATKADLVDFDEHVEDFMQVKTDYLAQRQQDQLKVAKVEKDINDYKSTMASVNVNQEAKQKVTGYGAISLPKNAANGQVSVSVKGNTIFNYADNGVNYANWVIAGAGTTKGAVGLHLVADGNSEKAQLSINLKPSTQYTLVYNVKSQNLDGVFNFVNGGLLSVNLMNLSKNIGLNKVTFSTLSNITVPSVFLNISSGTNGTYIDFEIYGIYEGDQTNNPLVNYPLTYGTKSTVSAMRLKSVGKNLFDGKLELGSIDIATGQPISQSSYYRTVNPIKINPSTHYVTKDFNNESQVIRIHQYDKDMNYINYLSTTGTRRAIITDANAKYIKISRQVSAISVFPLLQTEQNTVATPYEPYTESTQYLPNVGELRSLPNGVRDEIRVSGGKAEHIKRVSDEVNTWELVWDNGSSAGSTTENYWSLTTSSLSNLISRTVTVRWNLKNYNGISHTSFNDYNITDKLSSIISANSDILYLKIPKAEMEIVSSSNIMAWLEQNQVTLTYQLAEPIITPIQTSGNLISNPSGTVYVENVVADAGNYTTKFDIKELQLPIKSIDKLIKYNFETGVQTVLDTSLAVINADKKSFTHPNLTKDDMVFVDYYYDVESTLGETTIDYLSHLEDTMPHEFRDLKNDKTYKYGFQISEEGNPQLIFKEVEDV